MKWESFEMFEIFALPKIGKKTNLLCELFGGHEDIFSWLEPDQK